MGIVREGEKEKLWFGRKMEEFKSECGKNIHGRLCLWVSIRFCAFLSAKAPSTPFASPASFLELSTDNSMLNFATNMQFAIEFALFFANAFIHSN